jgi:hypothetical protein
VSIFGRFVPPQLGASAALQQFTVCAVRSRYFKNNALQPMRLCVCARGLVQHMKWHLRRLKEARDGARAHSFFSDLFPLTWLSALSNASVVAHSISRGRVRVYMQ